MRVLALAAAAALAIQAGPGQAGPGQAGVAQQAGDAPLQPSGPWGIDYGETLCTLSRSFGAGEGQVSLGFIPLTGGNAVKIVMIGVPNGDKSGTNPATFGSGPQAAKRSSFTTTDPKTGKPIAMIRARRDDLPLIAADKTLAIGIGHRQVLFAMSDAAEALKALAACETDLLKTWGYDPATIATMPKPIAIATWLEDKDYPGSALSQNQAGETNFRLAVGVDGKPTGCSVTLASGAPALDASACAALMKRARFEPATGTDGKPVPGLFAHSVMWIMGPMRTN